MTSNFLVTAGPNTLQFVGVGPQGGDNTALIDDVVLASANDQINDGSFEAPTVTATGANGSCLRPMVRPGSSPRPRG